MSDSVEKFVLEYAVDLKASLERLERLQDAVEETGKKAKTTGASVGGVFKDMSTELRPLFGEMGLLDSAIARIGYRVAWLAPIMATLAVAVKSVLDVRKEYEAQRKLSFESGMSVMAIEQFQRQANKSSGGVINAEGARGILQKTSNLAFQAYTNPDVMSRESLVLNRLGTSAFDQSGNIKATNKILDEMGNKMRSVSQQQAVAIGALAGFTADEVKAIRNRTSALQESTKMSDAEQQKLIQQQKALETIRGSLGRTQEAWRRIELVIGSTIMPVVEELLTNTAEEIEFIQKVFQIMRDGWDEFVERFMWDLKHPFATSEEKTAAAVDRMMNQILKDQGERNAKETREQDRQMQETRNAQALFTRDINLFSSAVSTFAGVIDERQAWAAWAGEIGKASGLGGALGTTALATGATESSPVADMPVSPATYDQIFASEAAKYKHLGVTAELLKAITQVESGFNPNAVSEANARGLMQIMPGNFKGLGITNAFDPRQNIAGGAQLIAEYLKASGGDIRTALTMYHGGYDQSGWGPRTRAYPDKVLAALDQVNKAGAAPRIDGNMAVPDALPKRSPYDNINSTRPAGASPYPLVTTETADLATVKMPAGRTAPVAGQSRESIQLRSIQEAIAGYLGVPVEQVMQGMVSRGDVEFANKYLKMGTEREYIKNVQMSKMPGIRPNVAAEAAKNARAAAFQLQAFDKFGTMVEGKARPGGRDITVGQKEVVININGYDKDPRALAEETRGVLLQDDVNDINNLMAAPNKW